MKKIAAFIVLISMFALGIFALFNNKANANKIKIVTALAPQYNFIGAITGKNAVLENLINSSDELLSFDPSKEDIEKIQNCDIFIYAGLESDKWIEKILPSIYLSNNQVIALINLSEDFNEETDEEMQDFEEYKEETAEDILNSYEKVQNIINNLCEILQEADPKNSARYKKNTSNFIKKLNDLRTHQ